jgi:hypothetical protein
MKRIPLTIIFVVVGVLMATAQVRGENTMPASGSSLPKAAAATVSELLSLSQEEFVFLPGGSYMDHKANLTKAHMKFLDLLKVLDRQVDADLARKVAESGGGGIERNLIEMARDYSKHPEHYAALLGFYEHPANLRMHILTPPGLQREHALEEYRAAWELLLLAPCTDGSRFMRPTCFDAIAAIRNDASIPMLLYLYERANARLQIGLQRDALDKQLKVLGTLNRDCSVALEEQRKVVGTLNRYCNAVSLHAMLRCVAISETVEPPLPKETRYNMKEWVIGHLRYLAHYDKPWREVIAAVLKENLSDADRSFLQDVLKPAAGEDDKAGSKKVDPK